MSLTASSVELKWTSTAATGSRLNLTVYVSADLSRRVNERGLNSMRVAGREAWMLTVTVGVDKSEIVHVPVSHALSDHAQVYSHCS